MSGRRVSVLVGPFAGRAHRRAYLRVLAAITACGVADTAEPLAAEAGRPVSEPYGDD